MCKWLKEYDEAAKNIRDKGLSSDQYKIRIMDLKMYMIIFTVILVPASFLGFFMYKTFGGLDLFLLLSLQFQILWRIEV